MGVEYRKTSNVHLLTEFETGGQMTLLCCFNMGSCSDNAYEFRVAILGLGVFMMAAAAYASLLR